MPEAAAGMMPGVGVAQHLRVHVFLLLRHNVFLEALEILLRVLLLLVPGESLVFLDIGVPLVILLFARVQKFDLFPAVEHVSVFELFEVDHLRGQGV